MKKRIKLNTYDRPDRPRFETNEEREKFIRSVVPPAMKKRIRVIDWFWVAEVSIDWVNREPAVK